MTSSPQFVIQTYVLLRTSISEQSPFILVTQFSSILLSLYAISDKLISDDSKLFIEKSGANTAWYPNPKWIYRILFRLCEVISNLFLIIVISVFYGAYAASFYVLCLLFINYILYRNGLLGDGVSNIFSYLVAVMNLGLTPKHNVQHNEKKIACLSPIYQGIIKFIFIYCFKCCSCSCNCNCMCCCKNNNNSNKNSKYKRHFSYYLVYFRVIQGVFITIITIFLYYYTRKMNFHDVIFFLPDESARYQNTLQMQIYLYTMLITFVLQIVFYKLIFECMNLGVSLLRNSKTYVMNYQFSDAIRLEQIKKDRPNDIEIFDKILKELIDENVPLLMINAKDKSNPNINKQDINEHLHLIEELNQLISLHSNEAQKLFIDILEMSIFNCHSTLIGFLITNKWIDILSQLKFGEKKQNKNILSYIIENCSHRSDIMRDVITKYDKYFQFGQFNHFSQLLKEPSGNMTRYGACQYVIHELLISVKRYPDIIEHLTNNYSTQFWETETLRYCLEYNYFDIIDGTRLNKETIISIANGGVGGIWKQIYSIEINYQHLEMLVKFLDNHDLNLGDIEGYKISAERRYEWFSIVLLSNNFDLYCNYLKLIPDINAQLYNQGSKEITGDYLSVFIYLYQLMENKLNINRFDYAKELLTKYDVDVNKTIGENSFSTCNYGKEFHLKANALHLAIRFEYVDIVKCILENKKDKIDFNYIAKRSEKFSPKDRLINTDLTIIDWLNEMDGPTQDEMLEALIEYVDECKIIKDKKKTKIKKKKSLTTSTTPQKEEKEKEKKQQDDKILSDDDHMTIHISKDVVEIEDNTMKLKFIIEKMLYDAYSENNFTLFDVLLEQWNNHFSIDTSASIDGYNENEKYLINVFNFDNEKNLLQLINNDHSNGQNERNLALSFALFEKYFYNSGNIDQAIKDCDLHRIITENINSKNMSFVHKLISLKFLTQTNYQELLFTGESGFGINGIVDVLLNNFKKKRSVVLLRRLLSKNSEFILNSQFIGTRLFSYGIANEILKHNKCLDLFRLICGEYNFSFVAIRTDRLTRHVYWKEILKIWQIEAKHNIIHEALARDIITVCLSHENRIFIDYWFKLINSKDSNIKGGSKDIIKNHTELIVTRVKSLYMLEMFIANGLVVPSLNEAIQTVNISEVVIRYIINKQEKTAVTMNELNLRLKYLNKKFYNILYCLLSFASADTRSQFLESSKPIETETEAEMKTSNDDNNNNLMRCHDCNFIHLVYYLMIDIDDKKVDEVSKQIEKDYLANGTFTSARSKESIYKSSVERPLRGLIWYYKCRNHKFGLSHDHVARNFKIKAYEDCMYINRNMNNNNDNSINPTDTSPDDHDGPKIESDSDISRVIAENIKGLHTDDFGKDVLMEKLFYCVTVDTWEAMLKQQQYDNYLGSVLNRIIPRLYGIAVDTKREEFITHFEKKYSKYLKSNTTRYNDNDERKDEFVTQWQQYTELKTYNVVMNRISNSLLNLYQRYIESEDVNNLNNVGNDRDSIQMQFIRIFFCSEKFFCNPNYQYCIKSDIIGTIETNKNEKGMYLFHSILKYSNLSNVLLFIMKHKMYNNIIVSQPIWNTKSSSDVGAEKTLTKILIHNHSNVNRSRMEQTNGNNENILLLFDNNGQIPIQCLVFGSYNEKYQMLKYNENLKDNQDDVDLIQLLHDLQTRTIKIKLKNIV